MNINSWLFFDKMITPRIIKAFYWILLFFTIISGIFGIFINPVSIIITVISIIILRISCEVVILMFNIYQQIKKLPTIFLSIVQKKPTYIIKKRTFSPHTIRSFPVHYGSAPVSATPGENFVLVFQRANHNAGYTACPVR